MTLDDGKRFVFGMTKSSRIKAITINSYIFASHYTQDKTVLDAACGSGFGTFLFAQEAQEVWGIDHSEESIEYAKKNFSHPQVKFLCDNIVSTKLLPKNYFDVAVSLFTLEQLPKNTMPHFLKSLSDSLKDNGILILSTPNKMITSPHHKNPLNKVNQYELSESELDDLLKPHFIVENWFGQRQIFFLYTWRWARFLIGRVLKFFRIRDNLLGHHLCTEVREKKFYRIPSYFVVIARKKQ